MCILAEGDAMKRDDLIYLEKLPLFTPRERLCGIEPRLSDYRRPWRAKVLSRRTKAGKKDPSHSLRFLGTTRLRFVSSGQPRNF
jgi:hypothetical protein